MSNETKIDQKGHMCITEVIVAARGVWFLVFTIFAQFEQTFSLPLQYKLESSKSDKQLKIRVSKTNYRTWGFNENFLFTYVLNIVAVFWRQNLLQLSLNFGDKMYQKWIMYQTVSSRDFSNFFIFGHRCIMAPK